MPNLWTYLSELNLFTCLIALVIATLIYAYLIAKDVPKTAELKIFKNLEVLVNHSVFLGSIFGHLSAFLLVITISYRSIDSRLFLRTFEESIQSLAVAPEPPYSNYILYTSQFATKKLLEPDLLTKHCQAQKPIQSLFMLTMCTYYLDKKVFYELTRAEGWDNAKVFSPTQSYRVIITIGLYRTSVIDNLL